MRPVLSLLVPAILTLSSSSLGQPQPAPRPAPVPPGAVPIRPGVPAKPQVNVQPTLLQVDVYQVETTLDRTASLDLEKVSQNKPARTEILRRLNEFGTARLMLRFDSTVNFNAPVTLTTGSRVPVVQDISINAAGKATPSVTYSEIGTTLNIHGIWRDDGPPIADITFKYESSGIAKTSIEASSGVRLPSFNRLKIEQFLTLQSGRPVLIMTSELPEPGDEKGKTILTILNVMAQRLDGQAQTRPAEEASAGQQTMIQIEIVELTANDRNLDVEAVEEQLPAGATIENDLEALKKFGQVEVLSRPTILVTWPEEASLTVGERVPFVESVTTSPAGEPEPKIGYKNVGLDVTIRGRWLESTNPPRAELVLDIRQQRKTSDSVTLAKGIVSPKFASSASQRTLSVQAEKPAWITFRQADPGEGNKARLILVRLTAYRVA